MVHLLKTFLESVKLVSGMLTIGEDTGGYAKRYRCPLGIYLMTVLSSLYSIIMDRAINAPGHRWICFGTKCKDKYYLKG